MGNISNVPLLERPIEKLKLFGEESLTNSELLSIIINSGTKEKSSLDIAKELINNSQNSLKFLIDDSFEEISKQSGIGVVKASQLKAIGEISKRILTPSSNNFKINSRQDVIRFIGNEMSYEKNEILKLILLNNQNYAFKIKTLAVGSESNIIVNLKPILSEAIRSMAPKIFLIHNHPSGNPKPSEADIDFTQRLKEAAKLVDIELLDHIIVSENGFDNI
jgi:DNA repair protein RadC